MVGVASEAAFCTRGHFIRHTPTNAHVRDPLKTASFLPHSPLALPPGVRDAHTLTPYLAGAQLEYTGPRLLLWSPLLLLLTEQHGTDSGGLSSILNTFHKVMVSWLISLPFCTQCRWHQDLSICMACTRTASHGQASSLASCLAAPPTHVGPCARNRDQSAATPGGNSPAGWQKPCLWPSCGLELSGSLAASRGSSLEPAPKGTETAAWASLLWPPKLCAQLCSGASPCSGKEGPCPHRNAT